MINFGRNSARCCPKLKFFRFMPTVTCSLVLLAGTSFETLLVIDIVTCQTRPTNTCPGVSARAGQMLFRLSRTMDQPTSPSFRFLILQNVRSQHRGYVRCHRDAPFPILSFVCSSCGSFAFLPLLPVIYTSRCIFNQLCTDIRLSKRAFLSNEQSRIR